jgi:hypothetical protein
MQLLKDYLSKYKNLEPPEASAKRLFIQVVKDECGLEIEPEQVSIRNGNAFIQCHPALRSELRLCATRVLGTLQQQGVRIGRIT